jgi:hypothetical protein
MDKYGDAVMFVAEKEINLPAFTIALPGEVRLSKVPKC